MKKIIRIMAVGLLISIIASGCSNETDPVVSENVYSNEPSIQNDGGNGIFVSGYPIVDTNQTVFYSNTATINEPAEGEAFYGQDASYMGNQPSYTDNGDSTITDNVTGLMWQKTLDEKMTYDEALEYAMESSLGGYNDWRVPTIKELFSLIDYTGEAFGEKASVLFIDTDYFDQPIGDVSAGEREIDAQVLSSTVYAGTTMNNISTVFGVNFIDGRIKGYPMYTDRDGYKEYYVRLVRGNEEYGINQFVDNGDGTITDLATGLMWLQSDDSLTRNWEEALNYCETLSFAGYDDWRLPNAKELQSIVDYTKSPQTSNSPAIDDMFILTKIVDVNGNENYGFYWTSTTHMDGVNKSDGAAYVAFGEALGKMNNTVMDVHGAGAVRSDPKSGEADDYPQFFGPQGDIRYVYNFVLAVRDAGN
ncbi:MAG TPA: DUF1566 domain-containing protein [Clostridia bacterium]|nr:DUF1566 domain-containing protein [Clostridia bacterium]HPQ48257.1 DUF1566 domain-containing protein [Clostridia bacterium]HRX43239.1 DUF1566 domain-containing protein [Clostridia bacterium]